MKFIERFILMLAVIVPLLFSPYGLYGQEEEKKEEKEEKEDKFVRLMSAQSVSLLEIDGKNYRKAVGPARFLHNDTWLICDTAWWNVDDNLILAVGNVSIEQENTELKSDKLTYLVDSSLAEFRGNIVQLSDKDGNTLRTSDLDYNTKDSVAVFRHGGSLRDKDGQIIESNQGTYDAKASLFTFHNNVNMFTDSAFVKTPDLWYDSKASMVTFPDSVDVWRDDYLLSGHRGWYDRGKDIFFFRDSVHGQSRDKEMWSDSLYFYRTTNDFDMLGNVQMVDTTRKMTALAGKIYHVDSLDYVTLSRDPVMMARTKEKTKKGEVIDTAYFAADTIIYYMVKRCEVDPVEVETAKKRLEEAAVDPVANIRLKAKEASDKKIKEAIEADPNIDPAIKKKYAYLFPVDSAKIAAKVDEEDDTPGLDGGSEENVPARDSLAVKDSLVVKDSLAVRDSLARVDSLANLDTTKLGFILAFGKVKVFRDNMQAVCDSLRYGDVDSLVRLYKKPVIWNESGQHQYSADSIYLVTNYKGLDKAFLLSSAFIHVREGMKYYDQIKSTEMTAYFDEDTQLSRFDALGGVSSLFYLREDNTYTTVNKSESTIMSVDFKKGELQGVRYFESPKSDVYPVPQMTLNDSRLKGFNWQEEIRPLSPRDLSWRTPRPSQRLEYDGHEKASFFVTKKYFPGYMTGVYKEIAVRDSLKRWGKTMTSDTTAVNAAIATEVPEAEVEIPAVAAEAPTVVAEAPAVVETAPVVVAEAAAVVEAAPVVVAEAPAVSTAVAIAPAYVLPDSLAMIMESLSVELDSLLQAELDSLNGIMLYVPDSVNGESEPKLTKSQIRSARAKAKREERIRKKEAKWAELDARDAKKLADKEARKQARKDKKAREQMRRILEEKRKEDALREKYKQEALRKLRK